MADERIVCPKCGRQVVPRLWQVRQRLAYLKSQHLCPFCGTVMYETGGEIRWGCVILLLLGILLICLPAIIVLITGIMRRH